MGTNASRARRLRRRHLTIPEGSRCQDCGSPDALTKQGGTIRCYRCMQERRKRAPFEAHHVFGPEMPTVLQMDANLHRLLEDAKYAWPDAVRDPSVPRPMRLLLMFLLMLRDLGRILFEYGQLFVEWLLDLLRKLCDTHGPEWDRVLGLRPLYRQV
jgi:hypothetical protein